MKSFLYYTKVLQGAFYYGEKQKKKTKTKKKNHEIYLTYAVNSNEFVSIINRIFHCETDYYGAAEPPVRCGVSHLSELTEPLLEIAI